MAGSSWFEILRRFAPQDDGCVLHRGSPSSEAWGLSVEEKPLELLLGKWRAEEIPLHAVAQPGLEKLQLPIRLYPLGHDFEAQAVGHGDHRGGDRAVTRLCRDSLHEGLIELQRIDWKSLEIVQRGVARAEIVHGDPDAEPLELQQRVNRVLGILHGVAFGD